MKLSFREFSSADDQQIPLIMLHGLFGSAANLQQVGKSLSSQRWVVLPDLRNHGRSPHDPDVSYQAMVNDVLRLMDQKDCERVDLMGHSMGGKVAMLLALEHPDRVNHLIVADIAPVRYPNRFPVILKALSDLDLTRLEKRSDADGMLSEALPEKSLRNYLLQNLLFENGQWQWRLNLDALSEGIEDILGFPGSSLEYDKPVLFLKGQHSDYLSANNEAELYRYFPMAEIVELEHAGHWLYAEQPAAFIQAIKSFCCH